MKFSFTKLYDLVYYGLLQWTIIDGFQEEIHRLSLIAYNGFDLTRNLAVKAIVS